MSVNEKMTAIADAIRDKTKKTELLNLDQIAESIPEVYESGKKSEYDAFWDDFQDYGNRTDFYTAFAGTGWTDKNTNPKYLVKPTDAQLMFNKSRITFDPTSHPKFDFSECDIFTQWISNSDVTTIAHIDVTKTSQNAARFLFHYAQKLVTVGKFTVGATPVNTNYFQSCFLNTKELQNITFEGEICYDIDMSSCTKLTLDSIQSAVFSLATNATGKTATFSKEAINKAFETSEGANDGQYSNLWSAFVGQRLNWTIVLK